MEATAIVRLHNPDQPEIPIELKVVAKPPIEFSPYPAVFFTAYQDESPEKVVRVINNEEAPLRIERIEFPEDHYRVVVDTVEPGKIYELRVKGFVSASRLGDTPNPSICKPIAFKNPVCR